MSSTEILGLPTYALFMIQRHRLPSDESPLPTGHQKQILRPLLIWSGIGIGIGLLVGTLFAQLASGIWFWEWRLTLDSGRWFDVARSTVATVGLFGLGGAALIALRRQHTLEAQHALDTSKQAAANITDLRSRYATAAEQLGHDRPAVRLAGIYALAALADDWKAVGVPEQQEVCVNLLCAYFRMPYEPKSESAKNGEREVRLTLLKTLTEHLHDPEDEDTWCHLDLDFTGAVFDGGTFSRAHILPGTTLNFAGAMFVTGFVDFQFIHMHGGTLDFAGAKFLGSYVKFSTSIFDGGSVNLSGAEFVDGQVSFSDGVLHTNFLFYKSIFEGGEVLFEYVAVAGAITFQDAAFLGGTLSFNDSQFLQESRTGFFESRIEGGFLSFRDASFEGGKVDFSHSLFTGGTADFSAAADWRTPPTFGSGLTPPSGVLPQGLVATWHRAPELDAPSTIPPHQRN